MQKWEHSQGIHGKWIHVVLSRLQPATLLRVTLFHGCFSRLLNFAHGTKPRNAPHIGLSFSWKTTSDVRGRCKMFLIRLLKVVRGFLKHSGQDQELLWIFVKGASSSSSCFHRMIPMHQFLLQAITYRFS